MEIRYQKLEPHQREYLSAMIELYIIVFERENSSIPSIEYLERLLQDERMMFMSAILDNEVVGALTAYVLPSVYGTFNEVFLYDLAIKTTLQRKGIGRHLLYELKAYCKQMGYREIFVAGEMEDTDAILFYKAAGGLPQNVVHFSYPI